jgi:catechol 2,3-dioxygenase-like lactoylglutathione lyase family enzyme
MSPAGLALHRRVVAVLRIFRRPLSAEGRDDDNAVMTDSAKTLIHGISTVGIPVTDQDRALAFYRDTVGLDLLMDAPLPGGSARWIMLAPPGASVSVSLVAASDGVPAGVETGIRFAAGDAQAVYDAFRERDVPVGELLRWPGVPAMFQAHDPDGNGFEVVEG